MHGEYPKAQGSRKGQLPARFSLCNKFRTVGFRLHIQCLQKSICLKQLALLSPTQHKSFCFQPDHSLNSPPAKGTPPTTPFDLPGFPPSYQSVGSVLVVWIGPKLRLVLRTVGESSAFVWIDFGGLQVFRAKEKMQWLVLSVWIRDNSDFGMIPRWFQRETKRTTPKSTWISHFPTFRARNLPEFPSIQSTCALSLLPGSSRLPLAKAHPAHSKPAGSQKFSGKGPPVPAMLSSRYQLPPGGVYLNPRP